MTDTQAPDKQQIEERVMAALVEFGEQRENLTLEAEFESLDVDSLDLVELAQIVEDEYKVEVADSDLDALKTVGDVVDLIHARLA